MYTDPLYRPPSEAYSLIIQVTEGCSHNKCRFCNMYKGKQFRVRSKGELKEHIEWLKLYHPIVDRIFLADGNVLCLKTEKILELLDLIKKHFPTATRISSYSGPLDLIRKSEEELKTINEAGLDMLYMGVESGSDKVLKFMNKGVNQQQMIEAGQKAVRTGFKLSCMIISGLGGAEFMEEHAVESAKVISAINPHYFSLLRLVTDENSELYDDIKQGKFHLATPLQILDENIMILENMELKNCIFRANHISNYINQAGTLNEDREKLIEALKKIRDSGNYASRVINRI